MKIVLNRDVKNLGKVGDVCEVANGYGRNFLLPKGYAIVASKQNIEKLNKKIEELKASNLKMEDEARKVVALLEKEVFNVVRQAADDDTIYGSIKNRDVYKMIEVFLTNNNIKFVFDLGGIEIKEPIKALGQYKIVVNLFGNVATEIRLNVCRANADFESDIVAFDKKMEQKVSSGSESENKAKGAVAKLNEVVEKKQAKLAQKQAKAEEKRKAKAGKVEKTEEKEDKEEKKEQQVDATESDAK